jgi:poly-beta-1,6-N-acetyl-D-glucosamine synthase
MEIAASTFLFLTLIYLLRMGLWLRAWKNIQISHKSQEESEPISIVICFRNECEKLPVLLKQLIPQLDDIPGSEIILVDDHSSDEGVTLLQPLIAGKHAVKLIHPGELSGKKACQHLAISNAKNDWIATLDADVLIENQWLKTLSSETSKTSTELFILPLIVEDHRSVFTKLQSLEFHSILFVTASSAASNSPILCNGANLAFRKKLFTAFNSSRHDLNISSGDDMFLLSFAQKKGRVNWIHDKRLLAATAGENGIAAFLAQRVRWASKTSGVKNTPLLFAAMLIFLINFSFVITVAIQLCNKKISIIWLIAFCLKALMDYFILRNVSNWLCKTRLMRFFPVLVILYPLYAILIPLLGIFWKPQWKERRLQI